MSAMYDGFLSETLAKIKPSATLAMGARATALREEGKDILDLTLGEPDFLSPLHVREAVAAAILRGEADKYPPVPGLPALRKAIVAKFKRENNLDYHVAQVMVC